MVPNSVDLIDFKLYDLQLFFNISSNILSKLSDSGTTTLSDICFDDGALNLENDTKIIVADDIRRTINDNRTYPRPFKNPKIIDTNKNDKSVISCCVDLNLVRANTPANPKASVVLSAAELRPIILETSTIAHTANGYIIILKGISDWKPVLFLLNLYIKANIKPYAKDRSIHISEVFTSSVEFKIVSNAVCIMIIDILSNW